MTSLRSILRVHQLKIPVRLGCGKDERARPQWVEWDIECHFRTAPKASETDRLEDTVCYDQLARRLSAVCERQEYHLIEHLAAKALIEIEPLLLSISEIRLSVRKLSPPIAYENKGTSFELVKSFE